MKDKRIGIQKGDGRKEEEEKRKQRKCAQDDSMAFNLSGGENDHIPSRIFLPLSSQDFSHSFTLVGPQN